MKILVIQQKMIGDVLTSSIICENLKKAYPNAVIDYLIYEHTQPVVQNNPFIDNLILYKPDYRKSKKALWKFMMSLKKKHYDIVIDAYGKLESNLITYFSKAKTTISYHKWYTSWIYTNAIHPVPQKENGAINSRLLLLKPLKVKPTVFKPSIYLTDHELESSKEYLEKHKIDNLSPIFMMSILGSNKEKTYPLKYMAQVIEKIVLQTQGTVLFNYIPSQKEEVNTLYNLCNKETQKHIRADLYAPSLRNFLGLLSQCTALIGNEGGAVNMAKALNIPTFSIYSPNISKNAWNLFSDKRNIGVHLYDFKPKLKDKKLTNDELYQKFLFEYFEKELETFLRYIKN